MQIINELNELRKAVAALRADGKRIGLVPTMGALHDGHISLVDAIRGHCDAVAASIFVNPKQFGEGEDLDAYPRNLEADAALLEEKGVSILWAPKTSEVYPPGFATRVEVDRLTQGYCGAARPGHFDGVALVVAKLFNQLQADAAIFGEKDWQQLAIIRRMARDLDFGVTILGAPTMRSEDGLAMSSRNQYLSAAERERAAALPRALNAAAQEIRSGTDVQTALDHATAKLMKAGFDDPDYIALVDEISLRQLDTPQELNMRLLVAAKIGRTRLIDNLAV